MNKYRKKPVEVHAVQYDGTNWDVIERFVGKENTGILNYVKLNNKNSHISKRWRATCLCRKAITL